MSEKHNFLDFETLIKDKTPVANVSRWKQCRMQQILSSKCKAQNAQATGVSDASLLVKQRVNNKRFNLKHLGLIRGASQDPTHLSQRKCVSHMTVTQSHFPCTVAYTHTHRHNTEMENCSSTHDTSCCLKRDRLGY